MKRCYILGRLGPRQKWMRRGLALALLAFSYAARSEGQTLRAGHFPNITHVQALIAHGLSRQGKGWFEQRLPGVKIDWFIYNAGPGAMEAIFADSIDLTYAGPNPAINAYIKSRGQEVRIVAGAAEGRAGLVVQPDLRLNTPADFKGRRIATPQFGNTQDISARAWLASGGLKITQTGGDAQVVPAANPDQLSLFKTKQVDAVWTIEPWVSRLETEAGGKVLVEDRTSITTVLISSTKRLAASRDLVARFVAAHKELTAWINAHPEEAQRLARDEIEAETHFPVAPGLIARAWKRIVVTGEVSRKPLEDFVKNAQLAGFLRDSGDISQLVETP